MEAQAYEDQVQADSELLAAQRKAKEATAAADQAQQQADHPAAAPAPKTQAHDAPAKEGGGADGASNA